MTLHVMSASSTSSQSKSTRPGSRLRGLSYLRSYTSSINSSSTTTASSSNSHHSSQSPAVPTFTTATASPSLANSVNRLVVGAGAVESPSTTTTRPRRNTTTTFFITTPTTCLISTPNPSSPNPLSAPSTPARLHSQSQRRLSSVSNVFSSRQPSSEHHYPVTNIAGIGSLESGSGQNTIWRQSLVEGLYRPHQPGFVVAENRRAMPTQVSEYSAHAQMGGGSDLSAFREQLDHISNLFPGRPTNNTTTNNNNNNSNDSVPLATTSEAPRRPEARVPIASIRFIPHTDPRVTRESLHFSPIERLLHATGEIVRVGRYSDRDATKPDCPVGFKSKVVSRRHCEFWCDGGQWYIKDVKSSSGTFLNHIRLSPPGQESKAYPVNNGDIIQLGIDFKGGEEQIFRCVKMRVELNRCLNKGRNHFNVAAHNHLKKKLASIKPEDDTSSVHTSECSICLMGVAPCQSLFVAPCSHVWHYRCIRPLVEKEWPIFLCPNCRAVADLDREIEEDEEVVEAWETVPESILNGNEDASAVGGTAPVPVALKETANPTTATVDATSTSVSTAANVPAHIPTVALAPPVVPTVATTNTSVAANGSASAAPNGHQRNHSHAISEIDPLTDSLSETGSGSADDGPNRYAFQIEDVDNTNSDDNVDPTTILDGGSIASGEASPGFPMTPRNNVGPFVFHNTSAGIRPSNLSSRSS